MWALIGACSDGSSSSSSGLFSSGGSSSSGGERLGGYFVEWGVYQRNCHVKKIATSGSTETLTHIYYAFGNMQGGQCTIGDSYADYDRDWEYPNDCGLSCDASGYSAFSNLMSALRARFGNE